MEADTTVDPGSGVIKTVVALEISDDVSTLSSPTSWIDAPPGGVKSTSNVFSDVTCTPAELSEITFTVCTPSESEPAAIVKPLPPPRSTATPSRVADDIVCVSLKLTLTVIGAAASAALMPDASPETEIVASFGPSASTAKSFVKVPVLPAASFEVTSSD